MKRRLVQAAVVVATLSASASVWASTMCCGDLQCCLAMLACCFG